VLDIIKQHAAIFYKTTAKGIGAAVVEGSHQPPVHGRSGKFSLVSKSRSTNLTSAFDELRYGQQQRPQHHSRQRPFHGLLQRLVGKKHLRKLDKIISF
jgi:hypothetical protein